MSREGFHDLASRARDGDREAMDRVLGMLRPFIEDVARTYADPAQPVASTTDLVQEACLRAWDSIGSFRGGNHDEDTFAIFRAWIGRIVRRTGLNAKRDRRAKKRDPGRPPLRLDASAASPPGSPASASPSALHPPDPGASPSSVFRGGERGERVRAALAALDDEIGAAIVRMHYFEGLRLFEIARRLDMPYDPVRDRFRSAMRTLQKDLRGWL